MNTPLYKPLFISITLLLLLASMTSLPARADAQQAIQYFKQGKQFYQTGEYSKAIEQFSKTLKLNADAGRIYAAYDHDWLARSYMAINELDKAVTHFRQEMKVLEKHGKQQATEYATALNNLARVKRRMADYAEAEKLYQQALSIYSQTDGINSKAYSTTQINLGSVYEEMGAFAKAENLYLTALSTITKIAGKDDHSTAIVHNNLGLLYQKTQQLSESQKHLQQALRIYRATVGEKDPLYAIALLNLGITKMGLHNYQQAETLFIQSVEIFRSLKQLHSSYSSALSNLANLYIKKAEREQAHKIVLEMIDIDAQIYGRQHPLYADSLFMLAKLQAAAGDPAAIQTLIQSSNIIKDALGERHPTYAKHINSLALAYIDSGENAKAEPMLVQALDINRKIYQDKHPRIAAALNNLALLQLNMGNFSRAETLYREAIDIQADDVNYNNLAYVLGVQGKSSEALDAFRLGQSYSGELIHSLFDISSESQKLALVFEQNWGYYGMLSLIHRQLNDNEQAIRTGLDLLLSRKGIVFDAQARQQETLTRSLDPEASRLWIKLVDKRASLWPLLKNRPEDMSLDDYKTQVRQLQDEIKELEAKLASRSALIADRLQQRSIVAAQLAQQLNKDSALIEFVRIQDTDWDTGKFTTTQRYLAFTLKHDGKVALIDLGEADILDAKIQSNLKPLSTIGSDVQAQLEASHKLYDLIWQPLAASVADTASVFVSPDGLLNLVPFNALLNKEGQFLIESTQIAYVSSGRDLARTVSTIKPEQELYLAANPQFDLATAASSSTIADNSKVRSAAFALKFSPLPGTADEANKVPRYLTGKQTVVTGREATEKSVLHAKRSRIIHLATHGFFLQDQPSLATLNTRGAEALLEEDEPDTAASLPENYENPLLRSGLALAGANHASQSSTAEDGILTALEVSGMDLHGTQLVTLSACETGRGEVKSGEGVFGLRRAFALAGARNLVMSLWPVSDDVTAQQMQKFYQSYAQGEYPARAMREAQLNTISALRTKHGVAEPALWAPFMVQGQ